jgi:excisionase family DNA binding protein
MSHLSYKTARRHQRIVDLISRNLGRKYSLSAKLEGHLTGGTRQTSRRGLDVDANNERLLTPGEVAALFRVDPKTVTRWAASGRITSIRTPGGHRRFRESEVRALLRGDIEPAPQGHPAA